MRRLPTALAKAAAPWAVLLVVTGLVVLGMTPPTVVPADGDPAEFSAVRAFEHVAAIAGERRPIGSAGNAAARDYLVARVEAMGLEPESQEIVVDDYYSGSGEAPVVNVFARIAGTDPRGAIALVAHYDSVPETPGANDNASGVAAVLETGRALLAGPPLRNDVILVLSDGEEPAPRFGSTAFVEKYVSALDIRLVINFEALGGSGYSQLTELDGDEGTLISHYAAVVSRPGVSSALEDIGELIGGSNTDVAPFRDRDVPAFEFAYLRGSPIYHTPGDEISSMHLGSLQHHGSQAVALTRRFGDLDLSGLSGEGQEVFFSVGGRVVVHYPVELGVVVVVITGLLLGLTLWSDSRTGLGLPKAMAGGAWLLLTVVGVGVAVAIVWRLLVQWLWTKGGPSDAAAMVWLAGVVVVTSAATLVVHQRLGRRLGRLEIERGSLVLWWALAAAVSLSLPGAGYVFAWPVLIAVVVAAFLLGTWRARVGAFAAVAAVAIALVAPVSDTMFQLAQPRPGNLDSQIPETMAVVGLLVALVTVLLAPHLRRATD